MTYTFYKFFHLLGIFMVLFSLAAIFGHTFQGGSKKDFKGRKLMGAIHGIGLLISFVAGFGLIAKAGFTFTSVWIYVKLFGWLILGGFPALLYKMPASKIPFYVLMAVLLVVLYFVEYKPL